MILEFGKFKNLENLITHLDDLRESQREWAGISKTDEKNIFDDDVDALNIVINILEKLNSVSSSEISTLYEYYHAKIKEMYAEKNKNYGDSFGKSFEKYGMISVLMRMSDKWNRLETLILHKYSGDDEPLIDTLLDLANYCLMTAVEIEKLNSKESASK